MLLPKKLTVLSGPARSGKRAVDQQHVWQMQRLDEAMERLHVIRQAYEASVVFVQGRDVPHDGLWGWMRQCKRGLKEAEISVAILVRRPTHSGDGESNMRVDDEFCAGHTHRFEMSLVVFVAQACNTAISSTVLSPIHKIRLLAACRGMLRISW